MPDLTAKQLRFVEEYLVDANATQAAIRAGYSAKTADKQGPQLLGKTWVADAIAKRQAERSEKTGIDAEYVLRQAVKLHERCMSEEDFNAAGAAKALDLIGKHVEIQAFSENLSVTIRDEDRSDAEIWAELRALRERQAAIATTH